MPSFTSEPTRMHVAFVVHDLEASIAFYRALLGLEPTKRRADYAKFEPADPNLNLSLRLGRPDPRPSAAGGVHYGIEVRGPEAVAAAERVLARAGLGPEPERDVTCCHAVQDKVWVRDPDGNPWEVFWKRADAEVASAARAESGACCAPGSAGVGSTCCTPQPG